MMSAFPVMFLLFSKYSWFLAEVANVSFMKKVTYNVTVSYNKLLNLEKLIISETF